MSKEFDKSVYNENYFNTSFGGIPYCRDSHNGHWIKFFNNIAEKIKQYHSPVRVLDVGCAKGFLVEGLRDRGVQAFGFDISETAINDVREDIREFCKIGSVTDENMYNGEFDLITCIEVLEHTPESMAMKAIELMCSHTELIIFSSSPNDFEEPTHINVQPPEYWDNIFASYGFNRADISWPQTEIAPHTVIYIRKDIKRIESSFKEISNKLTTNMEKFEKNNIDLQNIASNISNLKSHTDYLINENMELKNTNNNMQIECGNLKNHLQVKEQFINHILSEKVSLENTNNHLNLQLSNIQNEINHIKGGHAFKLLTKYWGLRDNILPEGTKRRKLAKKIVGLGKGESNPIISTESSNHIISNNSSHDLWNEGFIKWIENTNEKEDTFYKEQSKKAEEFEIKPLFSILIPVYKIPLNLFKQTINSVLKQSYDRWELCIAQADVGNEELNAYLKLLSNEYPNIKVEYLNQNGGISRNTNKCLELASGEFIVLFDHDDLLTRDALYTMVEYINKAPHVDFLYSDKDQIDETGETRLNPLFKHKYSWVTMLSANYPTHLCVIRKSLIDDYNLFFNPETDGAQDWDMFLKISEHAREIVHVPHVLYHWRIISTSVASGLEAKPYVVEAQNKTIADFIKRNNFDATVIRKNNHTFELNWNKTLVRDYEVIIYSENGMKLERVIKTLNSLKNQNHKPLKVTILTPNKFNGHIDVYNKHFEILLVEYKTTSQILQLDLFKTDSCLFLYAGIELKDANATQKMTTWLNKDGFDVMSGIIVNKDDRVINAGYVISDKNEIIEPYKGMNKDAYTTYASVDWYREYVAVSEFALMVKNSVLKEYIRNPIENNATIREVLFDVQLQVSEKTSKGSFYNPYIEFVLDDKQVKLSKIAIKPNINDPYFNNNVWDWNPEYLKKHFNVQMKMNSVPQDLGIWGGYTSDAMALAGLYDFNKKDLEQNELLVRNSSKLNEINTATWFLPPFSSAFYGGIHTILRFAEYLQTQNNIKNTFVIVGTNDTSSIKSAIIDAFPLLNGSVVKSVTKYNDLEMIPNSDIAFCTLWTTAYYLLKFNKTKKKFYFLQDWEPLFYPAGSTSAQVEATFRFGFKAICNTISLKESYEELGGEALYFTPAIDTSVFYPPTQEREEEPYLVFLYGRPGNPRNAFELAIPALRKVKEYFGSKVRIVSAGAEWDPKIYNAEGIIEHLGMLPYKETGNLYRKAHIGLTMMMTRHPSYLPFELMACGTLVVANRNQWNEWMLKDGVNSLVAEPSVSCIADTIIKALLEKEKRQEITRNAFKFIEDNASNWDKTFEHLPAFIKC